MNRQLEAKVIEAALETGAYQGRAQLGRGDGEFLVRIAQSSLEQGLCTAPVIAVLRAAGLGHQLPTWAREESKPAEEVDQILDLKARVRALEESVAYLQREQER